MIFVIMATTLASGALTAALLWPALDGLALLAAPVGASAAALVVAALAARWPGERPNQGSAEPPLDGIADELVAELRSLSEASAHLPRITPTRKVG